MGLAGWLLSQERAQAIGEVSSVRLVAGRDSGK